jgi:hypothetical protein
VWKKLSARVQTELIGYLKTVHFVRFVLDKCKVKQSRYRPGVAQTVPGS